MLIGLDRIAGYFGSAAIETWAETGRRLETTHEITARELLELRKNGKVAVIDVRGRSEWEAGHIPGVANIPLGYLTDRLQEIPQDRVVVLHCQTGWRSAIGASLLHAHGFQQVANLKGGIRSWLIDGNLVERG